MATPYQMVSRDAQLALQEFSAEFTDVWAAAEADGWASGLGLTKSSNAIRTTFPLPISAAGYKLRQGDDKMRSLFARSTSVQPVEYVDGVHELARIVEAPDFVGWVGEPGRIAKEARRQPDLLIAEMLEANPLLDLYAQEFALSRVASTIHLFSASHPVNIFDSAVGTFDNDLTTTSATLTAANVVTLKNYFRARKAPNGQSAKLKLTHLLYHSSLDEQIQDLLARDTLIETVLNGSTPVGGVAMQNRHKGTITTVPVDEFSETKYVYGIANGGAVFPWIIQTTGTPEEIRYDKTDELYKNTGRIAVKYVLTMGVAAALPYGIVRFELGAIA